MKTQALDRFSFRANNAHASMQALLSSLLPEAVPGPVQRLQHDIRPARPRKPLIAIAVYPSHAWPPPGALPHSCCGAVQFDGLRSGDTGG